ncbi:MAG TPA: carboxymuconolactone decarboxylase family protein [Candidatus Bathyarchaeia archaeon]|jgi:AhpD family alkylhydroperoxidase|nr:carboxymuconolactone decarboxylase family protein [Candidatus Bathyarchaeia archaeon]
MAERTMMEIMRESCPAVADAATGLVAAIMRQPALPEKTKQLIYLAVCTAVHHDRGVTAHAERARALGATREEVLEAMLLTIPAAGLSGASRNLAPAMALFER